VHLICDNYATHKHATVLTWLAKHPRFHMHFTPDLLVVVEPGGTLVPGTDRQGATPRRVPLRARPDRQDRGLPQHPQRQPKPFIWTATAEEILAKVARGRVALQAVNQ